MEPRLVKTPVKRRWCVYRTTGECRELAESEYLRMVQRADSGVNQPEVLILTLCGCGNCEHCREYATICREGEEQDAALIKQRAQRAAQRFGYTKGNASIAAGLLPENCLTCTCVKCEHCRKYAGITGSDECRHWRVGGERATKGGATESNASSASSSV